MPTAGDGMPTPRTLLRKAGWTRGFVRSLRNLAFDNSRYNDYCAAGSERHSLGDPADQTLQQPGGGGPGCTPAYGTPAAVAFERDAEAVRPVPALPILRGARDEGRACSAIAQRMINPDPDITRPVRLPGAPRAGCAQSRRPRPPGHQQPHHSGWPGAAGIAGWPDRRIQLQDDGAPRRAAATDATPASGSGPGAGEVRTQVRQLLDSKRPIQLWDVMTDEWFKGKDIAASRPVPLDEVGREVRSTNLPKNAEIVVYCGGPKCPQSRAWASRRRPSRKCNERHPSSDGPPGMAGL